MIFLVCMMKNWKRQSLLLACAVPQSLQSLLRPLQPLRTIATPEDITSLLFLDSGPASGGTIGIGDAVVRTGTRLAGWPTFWRPFSSGFRLPRKAFVDRMEPTVEGWGAPRTLDSSSIISLHLSIYRLLYCIVSHARTASTVPSCGSRRAEPDRNRTAQRSLDWKRINYCS